MQEGDVVAIPGSDDEWLVVEVEMANDPSLGCQLDMGRYTVLRRDGTEIANHPGYLMTFIRKLHA